MVARSAAAIWRGNNPYLGSHQSSLSFYGGDDETNNFIKLFTGYIKNIISTASKLQNISYPNATQIRKSDSYFEAVIMLFFTLLRDNLV